MDTPSAASPASDRVWLRPVGSRVVDGDGQHVVLRGFGLGGWLNMENFITGYASSEVLHRERMRAVLGDRIADTLFESFLQGFFTDTDAQFLSSLGVNSLRVPVNYRHFETDLEPGTFREEGFSLLDAAITACAAHGIYTIIDLHAAPGGQNGHWHSDTLFHRPQLWEQGGFQQRTIALWEAIADHYRDNPWVAGYNLLNEPAAENPSDLLGLYASIESAIRSIDSRHLLFLDGNRFATDFTGFGEPFDNAVYALHQYPPPCRFDGGPYPGTTDGEVYDRDRVRADFERMAAYMLDRDLPIWVGEFGPVYTGQPSGDAMKRQLLQDELDVYASFGAGWSLWTYKDMGMMGLMRARESSPWLVRTATFRTKKARLGVDIGGSSDADISGVMAPIMELFGSEFPGFNPYPFGMRSYVDRLVRAILLAEPLAHEFARCFEGISEDDAVSIGSSFRFEECDVDEDIRAIVESACKA